MSALGHYLEDEGVPTVQISLVREHTEALAPPRALWVPFALGRPLGVPNDPGFQMRVLRAALALFEREDGPVLEDYEEDAPVMDAEEDLGDLVCPVSFPSAAYAGSLAEQLANEVVQLAAWQALARQHRGRTTLGITGLSSEQLAARVGSWSEGAAIDSMRPDLGAADALRLACDELRVFYTEAKSVQPGRRSAADVQRWYWHETAAGRAVRAIRDRIGTSDDPALRALASSGLVPRAVDEGLQATR